MFRRFRPSWSVIVILGLLLGSALSAACVNGGDEGQQNPTGDCTYNETTHQCV